MSWTKTPKSNALPRAFLGLALIAAFHLPANAAPLDSKMTSDWTLESKASKHPDGLGAKASASAIPSYDPVTKPAIDLERRGAPPAPILLAPEPYEATSHGRVELRWRDGDGTHRAEFFRVCVFRAGGSCRSQDAWIAPGPGERPLEGTRFLVEDGLPGRFAGEVIEWTVEACAPDPVGLTWIGGPPPVICNAARARPLDWSRPVATLGEVDTTLRVPDWRGAIGFRWEHPDATRTHEQRFCFFEPGHACGDEQSRVETIPDTNEKEYWILGRHWIHQEGRRVFWTVALCDAQDDCAWAEPQEFTFPYRDSSFGTLLPVVRDRSCVNCHTFGRGNATYDRHVDLGRFGDWQDTSDATLCAGCHNAATGYADGWNSPGTSLPLECGSMAKNLRTRRSERTGSGYGSGGGNPAREHLENDSLIRWAIRQNPNVTDAEWLSMANAWLREDMSCIHEYRRGQGPPSYRYPWLEDLY